MRKPHPWAPSCGRAAPAAQPDVAYNARMRPALSAMLVSLLAGGAGAQVPPSLAPGDPAPELKIGVWLKGGAVASFEPGRLYVLDLWATTSAPCKESIPHLSELQQRYADALTVIGVSEELPQVVESYVNALAQAGKAGYRMAADPDGSTFKDYYHTSAREGLPAAFLIRDGRILWIGHPLELDKVLPRVQAGTWKVEDARKAFGLLYQLQIFHLVFERASGDEKLHILEGCLSAMGQLVALDEDLYGSFRVDQFQLLVGPLQRPKDAYALADTILEKDWDEAFSLHDLAWSIVDPAAMVQDRRLDVAMKAATHACELTRYEDAGLVSTLARVYYTAGDVREAVRLQERAVELAGKDAEPEQRVLDEYKKTLRDREI